MNQMNENRREFLRRTAMAAVAFPFLLNCKADILAQTSNGDVLSSIKKNALSYEGPGKWNGAKDAPENVSWKTTVAKETEPGERILISGTVFETDGRTPAPNVLIYLYHTDLEGFYGKKEKNEHRHGRFRGWMLTDRSGRYEFLTIKPAPYPEREFAAHIHMTLTTRNMKEDWVDSILFEGDRLITEKERREAGQKGGFNPIVKLERGADGIARTRRDIQLWRVS